MTDELRLGTLGREIFRGALSGSRGDTVLQGGITIPTPPQGGITIPTPPMFSETDDLPSPPHPLYGGGDLMILYGGITIPTP